MNARSLEFGIRITADGKVLVAEVGRAEKALGGIGNAARGVERDTAALTASFARVGHAAAAAFGVREIAQAADSFATLNARLALVSASATEAAVAYQRVYEIAQATRQGVAEVGLIYERFGRQADALGLSQQRLAAITASVSQAMVISGSSAESSRAALIQLGQGIASGTLRGEELNSVMEQAPRLAQVLADGLGVPIGQLRELGETGQLTAEKLVVALEKSAPALAAEFARMPVTIGQALTNIGNAWTDTVGSFERSTGVFRVVAGGLQGVATHMDVLVVAGGAVAAVMAGRLVGAGAAAVGSLTAQAAAAMTTKVQYDSLGMAIGATSGRAALAGAAVGALGGPIGIVTTALTLGATAWALWGDSAKNAADKARDSLRAAQDRAASEGRELVEILRERERAAKAAYDASPLDADGLRDITGSEGRAWTLSWQQLRDEETRLANLEERAKRTAGAISESWADLHRTKAQLRDAEVAKLDAQYAAETAKIKGNADLQLRLASEYQVKLQVINDKYKDKKHGADKAVIDASVEANKDYAKSISDLIGIEAKATGAAQELTAAEQVRERLIASGAWDKLAPETRKVVDAYVASANAAIRSAEAEKALHAAQQARLQEQYRALDANDAEIKQLEQHNAEIGLTTEAVDALRLARLDDAIAIKERQYAQAAATSADAAYIETLKEEVEQLKQIRDLRAAGSVKEASARLGKEMAQEFARGYDNLERGLTDTIIRGGENGLDNLADMYARTLKAMAVQQFFFRPIVQPVYSTVASMFGVNMAQAGGSWANTGNLMSAGNSAYNMFTGGFTAPGSMYSNFALSGLGQSLGLSTAGSNMTGVMGAWAGDTAMVSELSTLGSTIGTAAPYIAAAVAVLSMMDFGGGTPHKGATAFSDGTTAVSPRTDADILSNFVSASDADRFRGDRYTSRYQQGVGDSLQVLTSGLAGSFNQILGAYGLGRDYRVGASFASDNDDDSRARIVFQGADKQLLYSDYRKYDEDPQKGYQQFAAEAVNQLLLAVRGIDLDPVIDAWLDSSVVGATDKLDKLSQAQSEAILGVLQNGWLDEFLAQIDTASMSFEEVTGKVLKFAQVANLKPIFDSLGLSIYQVGTDLANLLGGADAAGATLAAYYNNSAYYSDAERRANTMAAITREFDKWGVAVPQSTADFRKLVDQVAALGANGTEAYAALMGVQSAFSDVMSAVSDVEAADVDAIAKARDAAADARASLIAGYQDEVATLADTRDKFASLAGSLRSFKAGLSLGQYSTLSPFQKYEEARRQAEDISRRAALGDAAAAEEQADAITAFLEASRAYNASNAQYAQDKAWADQQLDRSIGVAERQRDIAQDQLDALTGQAVQLGLIEEHAASLEDLFAEWVAANTAAGIVTPSVTAPSIISPGLVGVSSPTDEQMAGWRQNYLLSIVGRAANDSSQIESAAARAAANRFTPGEIAAAWNANTGADVTADELTAWARDLGIPGYDVGANRITRDHLALVHEGEEIRPAPYVDLERVERDDTNAMLRTLLSRQGGATSNADVVAALSRLGDRLDALISAVESGQAVGAQQARELKQHMSAALSAATRRAA